MAKDHNQGKGLKKELELESDDCQAEIEAPLPLTVTSRTLYMLGDITAGPAFRFTQWLQLVRKRTANYRSSGFPHRTSTTMPSTSCLRESLGDPKLVLHPDQTEISLWDRLGKAATLDIESSSFSWDMLSSLHHTEHSSSNEHSEDEMNKALELCAHR